MRAARTESGPSVIAAPRRRPQVAQLGLNRLALCLAGIQGLAAIVFLLSYRELGLNVAWVTALPLAGGDVTIAALWVYLWRVPGREREWIVAETIAAFLLLLTAGHVLAPAQYAAAALKRPLVDAVLARGDAALGVNVAALAAWTRAHTVANIVMTVAYNSFLPQLVIFLPLLGFVFRDRDALWEGLFHFHTCAVITIVCLALFPAAHAFQYLHFRSTLDQTRLITQFNGIRAGSFTIIRFDQLEGLISMPSFHFAQALIVVWAFRRHSAALWIFVPLNVLLTLSTVFTGTHYAVDLVGTVVLFSASVWCWKAWAGTLVRGQSASA